MNGINKKFEDAAPEANRQKNKNKS